MSKLKWTNPTGHTNSAEPYTQAEHAGYVLRVDGKDTHSLPVTWGTEVDLKTVAGLSNLTAGSHHAEIAVVSKSGAQSAFTPAGTFSVAAIPNAPGNASITD